MKVYYLLVSAFCVWIEPTHSQFFYSTYTPVHSHFTPFFHQPTYFSPVVPGLPLPLNLARSQPPNTATPSTVTYNLPPAGSTQFRGFGYRTEYKDGATATVYYVTGPESELLRSFRDFPNFSRKVQEDGRARSLASDIIDVNAVPDANGKIKNILQPAEIQKLFDNPLPGVINFYTYPAGTVPLTRQSLNSSESTTSEAPTTTTTSSTTTEEAVAAESVVNARILKNEIVSEDKSNQNAEISSTTAAQKETEAPTTVSTTSTESAEVKIEEKSPETETTESSTASTSEDVSKEVQEDNPTTVANVPETTTVESTTQA